MKPLIVAARFKYLLILPFLIIVPIAALLSYLNSSRAFVSEAHVWSQESRFVPVVQQAGYNPYISFAQNQAIRLQEHLGTDSFTTEAAARAKTTPYEIRNGTGVWASGTYVIVVRHRSPDPALARNVVRGIIDEFQEQNRADIEQEVERARGIYQAQLPQDEARLASAQWTLQAYLNEHPFNPTRVDPQLAGLQENFDLAQEALNQTRTNLNNVTIYGQRTVDAEEALSFRIVDEPQVPQQREARNLRRMLVMPAAGMLLAFSLAATAYVFLLKTDNSIRVAEDLQALPGLALLGTVPDVSPVRKRGWPSQFFRLAVTALGVSPSSR